MRAWNWGGGSHSWRRGGGFSLSAETPKLVRLFTDSRRLRRCSSCSESEGALWDRKLQSDAGQRNLGGGRGTLQKILGARGNRASSSKRKFTLNKKQLPLYHCTWGQIPGGVACLKEMEHLSGCFTVCVVKFGWEPWCLKAPPKYTFISTFFSCQKQSHTCRCRFEEKHFRYLNTCNDSHNLEPHQPFPSHSALL